MSFDHNSCFCECKFCEIHKYGVFLLNTSGVLIFTLVNYVYWPEIKAHFLGRARYIARPATSASPTEATDVSEDGPDSQQLAPDAIDSIRGTSELIVGHKQVYTTNQMPPPPIKIYLSTAQRVPGPQRSPSIRQAFKAAAIVSRSPTSPRASTPVPLVPQKQNTALPNTTVIDMGRTDNLPSSPPVSPFSKKAPETKSSDPFRLPKKTVDQQMNTVTRHESTGSDYFKQMFRGKKPVASISQYAALKHYKEAREKPIVKKGKKNDTDTAPKRHHKEKKHKEKKK